MRIPARPAWRWASFLVAGAMVVGLGLGLGWAGWRLAEGRLDRGAGAYDRGDWPGAADRARDRLRDAPTDRAALRVLARATARLGRHDEALGLFLRGLGADALGAEEYTLIGLGLRAKGDRLHAVEAFTSAREHDPNHAEALAGLATLYATMGRPIEAEGLAREVAARPGWEAVGEIARGEARLALDDPAGAAAAFTRGLTRDPDLARSPLSPREVRARLARVSLREGRPAEAIARLRALARPGTDPEIDWLLARASIQAGAIDEAGRHAVVASGRDPLASEPAPFLGSARCAECHSAISAVQGSSHHARTDTRGADLAAIALPPRPIADPADSRYQHTLTHEGDTIAARTTGPDGADYRAVVAFALGSGDRGVTLVGEDDAGQVRELRMSRYGGGVGWDVTSGQGDRVPTTGRDFLGKPITPDTQRQCIGCHATRARAKGVAAGPEDGDRGIGCERCHGPGGAHVAALDAAIPDLAVARPKLVAGPAIVRLCGQCHSPPSGSASPADPASVRFQAVTLTWSKCYTESFNTFDCVTCHDPHKNADHAPSTYERACLACHGPASNDPPPKFKTGPRALPIALRRTPCKVNPSGGCVTCHMPTVKDAIPHTPFTDHHIRIHAEPPAGRASAGGSR